MNPYLLAAKAVVDVGTGIVDDYGSEWGKNAIQYRKTVKADLDKVRSGADLGYSEGQKAAMLARTDSALQAKDAAQSAELSRQQAASGGGMSGAYAQAQRSLGAGTRAALAGEAASLEQQDAALSMQQRNDYLNRAQEQYRNRQQQWAARMSVDPKTGKRTGAVNATGMKAFDYAEQFVAPGGVSSAAQAAAHG